MQYDIYLVGKTTRGVNNDKLILVKKGTKSSDVKSRFDGVKKIGSCKSLIIYGINNKISIDEPIKC